MVSPPPISARRKDLLKSTTRTAPLATSGFALALRGALFALALIWPRLAEAHAPSFAVYSKYEATTSARDVAFVFALDTPSVLSLLEQDALPRDERRKLDLASLPQYRSFFSSYLFSRFSVANDGAACGHPDELGRFFWDERTTHVLAVTKFTCAAALGELTIRSLVTHDMPVPHELVGDLQHGETLVRRFFLGDEVETTISIPSLPASGLDEPRRPRRRGQISYVLEPDRIRRFDDLARAELGVSSSSAQLVGAHPWALLPRFVGEGVRHIFTGYDHVLFIVTLILTVGSWRRLGVIVTSFTAAHSITLLVATLGWVSMPERVVEPLIAGSVLFVAVDTAVRAQPRVRALIAFGFGLVHGFGLSTVLRDLGLSGKELAPALLGFNVGVEIGQLLIVTPLFALILFLRKNERRYSRVRSVLAAGVAVVAVFWVVVRVREALGG
jgi:hydrogenase/urease accessory protein HupE